MTAGMAASWNLKEKTRVRSWPFARPKMRAIVAFQAGAAAAVVCMIVIFTPLSYLWSSDGGIFKGFSSPLCNGDEIPQTENVRRNVIFLRDWELPQVREVQPDDTVGETAYGEVPRRLTPLGTGNFLFVFFSAYRTGPKSFVVLGLGPRLMHKSWSKPAFQCYWDSNATSSSPLAQADDTIFPDGDMVIQGTAANHYPQDLTHIPTVVEYTTVVVHCTFESPVGLDGNSGQLRVIADHGEYWREKSPLGWQKVEFTALIEDRGAYNSTSLEAPFQYEYMYCGGPLHGSVNPHRLREWVAYHMKLFGEKAHFMFYDDGGINDDLWRVLRPWAMLQRLTIMNVRQEARYDSWYHNQFLLTNDCLFRAKPLARWAFFFDIDEYLYVTGSPHLESSFHNVMSELAERDRKAAIVHFQQQVMSPALCSRNESAPNIQSEWAIEKLVYQRQITDEELINTEWNPLKDFKSAVQPKYVVVMGVHEPAEVELTEGFSCKQDMCAQPNVYLENKSCMYNSTGDKLVYHHYHGTINMIEELCQEFVDLNASNDIAQYDGVPYKYTDSVKLLADFVKEYESKMLERLQL